MTDKALKKWIGVPRSATNVVIHMKQTLGIKSISQTYTEMHTVSHTRTRLKGDTTVNNATDCTLEREGGWTTKKSTAVECEALYMNAKQLNSIQGEIPTFTGEDAAKLQSQFNTKVRDTVKTHMTTKHKETCMEKVMSLAVQGNTLALADAEATDSTWKSHIYDLKAGTLKFLVNAVIDTLPTAVNLKRWKKA